MLLAQPCATCVFRPGNPMACDPGDSASSSRTTVAVGAALICHSTLSYGDHPEVGESVNRRCWYDHYQDRTTAIESPNSRKPMEPDHPAPAARGPERCT